VLQPHEIEEKIKTDEIAFRKFGRTVGGPKRCVYGRIRGYCDNTNSFFDMERLARSNYFASHPEFIEQKTNSPEHSTIMVGNFEHNSILCVEWLQKKGIQE